MSRTIVYLTLLLLALCSVAGQVSTSASASATGRTRVRSSGGGTVRGFTSTSVTTSARTGRGKSKTKAKTTGTGSGRGRGRGKGKGKRSEEVKIRGGTVSSRSSVRGRGPVSASSSAVSGPGTRRGSASTTVGGKTRTVTKRGRGEERKEKRATRRKPRKTTKPKRRTRGAERYDECIGLAKFRCCDDEKLSTIGGKTFCGCWGSKPRKDLCSYEVVNRNPLVVRDIFGGFRGEVCQCSMINASEVDPCRGLMKRECCRNYAGQSTCGCTGTTCLYRRVSNAPLVWRHADNEDLTCVCEK